MKNEQNTRSIYHRKDGRWEARYASGRDRGGRIRYRSVYGKTRAEAEEKYLAAAAGMMTETGRNPCVAELLGFGGISLNSLDGVSDRDFCLELMSALSILMMHLSRLSEELGQDVSFASLGQSAKEDSLFRRALVEMAQ